MEVTGPLPSSLLFKRRRRIAIVLASVMVSIVGLHAKSLSAQDASNPIAETESVPVQTDSPIISSPAVPPPNDVIVPAQPMEPVTAEIPLVAPTPPASMFGGPLHTRPNLTGDWFGVRPALAADGISVDGNVTQFYQGVASGGRDQEARYGGHADYYLNVDGQKAGLWAGLFVTLHAETVFGQSANPLTGALLPVSFIQAVPSPNEPVTSLTAVKITQALSESFVTYFGKLNAFDDFRQPFASGRGVDAFMNTGFLFNPVLARTVPYSSFGAGAAYLHNGQPVASITFFDTNDNPTSSGFNTFFDNGVTTVGQVNLPTTFLDLPGHQGVGFSYSNGHYASLDRSTYLNQIIAGNFTAPRQTGSESVFYQFDQTLYTSDEDPTKSWGLFGNAGLADRNPSPIRWFANIGVGGSSPISGRPLDTFGLGYFYLGLNDNLKEFAPALFPLRNEQGVELFYNYAVTPWLRVTPDLQVIVPAREQTLPPNSQAIDTAVILGIRAKILF
jgi:porin